MPKQFDNEKKGVLFKNEGDKKKENGPDYSGTATIEGTEYFMDAWINTSDSGRKYMSFRFKAKQQRQATAPAPKPGRQQAQHDDDGPPW